MFRLGVSLLLFTLSLQADWITVWSGPFQVYTDAGEGTASEVLSDLEQFRWVLGNTIGKDDLQTVWPIRYIVFRSSRDRAAYKLPAPLVLGPDGWFSAGTKDDPIPPEWFADATRLLLEVNAGRLPDSYVRGLAKVFSTLQIDRTRIRLGEPVPEPERDLDWARIHLLVTARKYSARLPVLLRNMETMADNEPAFRNSLGKSSADLDREAQAHFRGGNFPVATPGGKPINAKRDFYVEKVDEDNADILFGGLSLVAKGREVEVLRLYRKHEDSPVAQTGLGLLALRAGKPEEAHSHFAKAADAKQPPARASYELALLERDVPQSVALLQKAAELNPKWAAPLAESAERSPTPQARALSLLEATKRRPQAAKWWEMLAETYEELEQYAEAGKAWSSAAVAAETEQERQRYSAQRIASASRAATASIDRRDAQRQAEKDRIEALKQETLAKLHAMANQGQEANPDPSAEPPPMLFGGKSPDKVLIGKLERVECVGPAYVLYLTSKDGSSAALSIPDVTLILVEGGELILRCGKLAKPLAVSIDYIAQENRELKTIGEVAIIHLK